MSALQMLIISLVVGALLGMCTFSHICSFRNRLKLRALPFISWVDKLLSGVPSGPPQVPMSGILLELYNSPLL